MKESSASTWNANHFWLGLFSAMASSVFIGSSLVIQKKALSRLGTVKSRRAKSIDWNCLKDWLWLSGVFLMGIGECFNFAAYALAPASLVAPLGAFSVIVAAGLSAKLLHEEINVLVWCGCIACILGSIVVIIHSPKTNFIYTVSDLVQGFKRTSFLFFCILTLLCVVALVALSPDYGKRNVLVYITICSLIGGYTVPACKALAVALVECISACSAQALYVTIISAVALVVCCAFQLYYLNKALNLFNTSLVTPIYYAFFTTAVVVSTGILFNEWIYLSTSDLLASFCGFLNILMGTFLMQVFKDVSVSMEQLRAMLRKRDRNASPDSTARLL